MNDDKVISEFLVWVRVAVNPLFDSPLESRDGNRKVKVLDQGLLERIGRS